MNKILLSLLMVLAAGIFISSCTKEDDPDTLNPLEKQSRVQVAYDASQIAFKFTWKSQKKLYPAGSANVGKNYPGHYHDFLVHNGTKFDRFASGTRMEEDRVSLMIDKFDGGVSQFATVGCAASCHTGMDSHHLLAEGTLDHWHWRGGRSGPMGYAEDAALNNIERIRDSQGPPNSKFLRSGGDRLREDQTALTGTAHAVLTDGFPRFVFNKGKKLGDNSTVSSFFLYNQSNSLITDAYNGAPLVEDLLVNRSLIVAYQDKAFDNVDKVNALDLGYLVWVATGEVSHLPSHLRDISNADFNSWKTTWATETGITTAAAALAKLNEVHQEWVNSGKKAMVTRSIGFIYNSDQHDITSERSYDPVRKEWTVILKRKLSTGSVNDADLAGLASGAKFTLAFAMHDSGSGSETHDISMPLVLSNGDAGDLKATFVSNIKDTKWEEVPAYDTHWVKQSAMPHFYYDWLKSSAHPGAGMVGINACSTCHTETSSSLFNNAVLN